MPRQIAALAAPVRQAVVDAISASGPCSVAEVATQLGRPANGLYHHVRALVAAGLLVERDTPAAQAGRPATRYDVPRRPLRIRYTPEDAATRRPMRKVVGAMTRLAAREFTAGYRVGVRVSGPRRELWAARAEAWLTDKDLERANAMMARLVQLFANARRPPSRGARLRSLVLVLAPAGDGDAP